VLTNILVIIHALLFCVYLHGKVAVFLKHLESANFLITKGLNLTRLSERTPHQAAWLFQMVVAGEEVTSDQQARKRLNAFLAALDL
jgi:hypothetical protein